MSYSQNAKDKLDIVKTREQAVKFVEENPELSPEIFTISPEIDTVNVPAYFKSLEIGFVLNEGENIFKVISVTKVKASRVSYIFLDGSNLSINEINKLRPQIIDQYKKKTAFSDLAKKYTMDTNSTGELNWFAEGTMVPEFESAIKTHKKGEIFTIDVPDNKWYYVTLKTHEDKEITQITMLKIKSGS
jgi:parvulin-like peptidyl-prolyl isomerase